MEPYVSRIVACCFTKNISEDERPSLSGSRDMSVLAFIKVMSAAGLEPRTLDLKSGALTTRPRRQSARDS